MNTRKTAFLAVFLAAAMILSYVESLIPFFFSIPGMKLGLTNACIVMVLYIYGPREALLINLLRIVLTGFMFGNMFSIIYSLAGGLLSFLIMYILYRTGLFAVITVSLMGGIFHNLGQNIAAALLIKNSYIMYYFPVLLIFGAVTGVLIGVISSELIRRLKKILVFG